MAMAADTPGQTAPDDHTFSQFMREVAEKLGGEASSKGYSDGGPDGRNPLFEVTGVEHACGEIVYKAVRFRRKGDPNDMLKAAAWAYLAWKHNR